MEKVFYTPSIMAVMGKFLKLKDISVLGRVCKMFSGTKWSSRMNEPLCMRLRVNQIWRADKELLGASDIMYALRVKTRDALRRRTEENVTFKCYNGKCGDVLSSRFLTNQDIYPHTTCVICIGQRMIDSGIYTCHGFRFYASYFEQHIKSKARDGEYLNVKPFLKSLLSRTFFDKLHIPSLPREAFPARNKGSTPPIMVYQIEDIRARVHSLFIEHKIMDRIDESFGRPAHPPPKRTRTSKVNDDDDEWVPE